MAAAKVLGSVELLELILLEVPAPDILLAASTCLQWRAIIESSKALRDRLISASEVRLPGIPCWNCCRRQARHPLVCRWRHPEHWSELRNHAVFNCPSCGCPPVSHDGPWSRIMVRRFRNGDRDEAYFACLMRDSKGELSSLLFVDDRTQPMVLHGPVQGSWTLTFEDETAGICQIARLTWIGSLGLPEWQHMTRFPEIKERDEHNVALPLDRMQKAKGCVPERRLSGACGLSDQEDDCLTASDIEWADWLC